MNLETRALRAALGGKQVLQGVDLQVEDGAFFGLIGPNGSGKSTLLRCVYRALAPSGGAVFLDGRPLRQYSVKESARRVAVLAQHNAYSFEFTVQDIVLMGRSPHKRLLDRDTAADRSIVREALAAVGLAGAQGRAFSTLSGGEQQRAVLARALAQQTPCLILDEPTNHLDIQYQLQMMEIVAGLGKTVLAAVHGLNIAAMYCDRLGVLVEGRLVACGPPREVLTQALIRRVYGVDATVMTDQDGQMHILYRRGGVVRA